MGLINKHKKYVIFAGIFIIMWSVSFYISTRFLMRETKEVVVPKVIGFPLIEAERMLGQRKLQIKIETYEETAEFPENTVVSQSVEPGTIVKENRVMLLHVSKQKDRIEIPNLIEKDLFEAKKIIEKQNLKLTNVVYACSKKTKTGKVASQNPLSEDLGVDQNIQLLVSSGPCQNQFMIGDVVDRRVDAPLKKEFTDKDIGIKQLSIQSTRENMKKAKIISQEPIAGSIVKSGDSVLLNME